MSSAHDFSFTSRLTAGVSYDDPHYDIVTSYFTPCANLPRGAAQQILRARDIRLKAGFFSVDNMCNTSMMAMPLGFLKNKLLCLSRENFSLNLLDDWGCHLNTLRVRTPHKLRPLYYHLRNEKALAARPRLYKKLLIHYNFESGYESRSFEDFNSLISTTFHLYSTLGKEVTNLIVSMSGSIPPYFALPNAFDQWGFESRPMIGTKPRYEDIRTINGSLFATLCKQPEAALTTEKV